MTARFVSDVSLHVAPGLLGVPLASPTRRLVAFVLDWAILMIPSIAVAVGAAALTLWMSDRRTFDALRTLWSEETTTPQAAHRARRDSVRLLVRVEAPGLPLAAVLSRSSGLARPRPVEGSEQTASARSGGTDLRAASQTSEEQGCDRCDR